MENRNGMFWSPVGSRPLWLWVITVLASTFGLLTLKSGGSVLLDIGGARAAAGDYVPFVLWFNFLAGFAYIAAGVGLWMRRRWGIRLALLIALATVLVFALLAVAILLGRPFEPRTLGAMTLRSGFWLAVSGWLCWRVGCR